MLPLRAQLSPVDLPVATHTSANVICLRYAKVANCAPAPTPTHLWVYRLRGFQAFVTRQKSYG